MGRNLLHIAVILWIAGLIDAPAWADIVKLNGRPAFQNVTISDFRRGMLVFRGVSGETLRKPLTEVDWIAVDDQEALNTAEEAAARGFWPGAVEFYRAALASGGDDWRETLVRVRLMAALDRAGQFDLAVQEFVELAHRDPHSAAFAPSRPAPPGSAINRAARETLAAAARQATAEAARIALQTRLLELLIYDNERTLPAEFVPAVSRSPAATFDTPDEAAPVSQPADRPPVAEGRRLFGDRPSRRLTRAVVNVTRDSLLLAAAREAVEAGDAGRAVRLLRRGMPYVNPDDLATWRFELSRALIEAGEPLAAADDLLRLLGESPPDELAAEIRYHLGLAHERMGRLDIARRYYAELSDDPAQRRDLRKRAEQALTRIGE